MPRWTRAVLLAAACLTSGGAQAQIEGVRSVNTYGVPGLIETPSAQMQPDAELTTSLTLLSNGIGRAQLAFQILPRVEGLFRYASVPDYLPRGNGEFFRTYDRSFDIRVQLLDEGSWRPAVTVGLQDFGGTGIYGAEYLVATKSIGDLTVSGGIGWGRLGGRGGFGNPLGALDARFDDRPGFDFAEGGDFSLDRLFRGDAALFAGLQYDATDRLAFKAEYSPDAYRLEQARGRDIIDPKTPLNLGVDYAVRPGIRLGLQAIQGAEIGLTVQIAANPNRAPLGSGIEETPRPVTLRPAYRENPDAWSRGWVSNPAVPAAVRTALDTGLADADLELVATRLDATRAEIRFRNRRYTTEAQAIGRAARAATAALPPSVETLVLVPLNTLGTAGSAVILQRSDVERLENAPDGTAQILAASRRVDAVTQPDEGLVTQPDAYPRLRWALGPYTTTTTFDPDNPFRIDLGAQLSGRYQPAPGVSFDGAVRQKIVGNRDEYDRPSNSVLPRVRTNSYLYAKENGPFVPYLTANYVFRPAPDFYGRASAGLLETQFGGVSAEVLWKRDGAPLAIGAEVNRVRQRDFDMAFGFRDLDATTAFVTGYYDHGNGFLSQVDVGRYLAGDEGATYTLTREFANGWRIGAYATKTNVSAEEFGEGSFDKGLSLRIPLGWMTGQQTQAGSALTIQPILRDGGARLNLRNRLYPLVRDQSAPDLSDEWGRFWR